MTAFSPSTTSEQVVDAFSAEVRGRSFVISGASEPSIGASIATSLTKASPPVLTAMRAENPSIKATFVPVDLSDHDSVRRAAPAIAEAAGGKIHVLVNSAGNMALKQYAVDRQGIEMQMSVNHVGHFLLTNLLMPALLDGAAEGSGARVINLTSAGYQISPVRFDDSAFSGGETYDPWTGYGQAKTAQILFAYGLTQRLGQRGVVSFACHPGSNLDTKLGSHLALSDYEDILPVTKRNTGQDFVFTLDDEPRFKTYDQIGATPLIAALDPDMAMRAPAYLQNNRIVQPLSEHAYGSEHVERCWKLSEGLVGQEFSY
ncbi:hypothetical protein F4778DRAFT_772245 [Xylariomycetidae sp. FL2044]|nr:hypothetical protein F4778DRAFT_772245 [Xylariomycetidae sp. FL2044]